MRRAKGARCLHIKAVAAALFIGDRNGAPALGHSNSVGEEKVNIKLDQKLTAQRYGIEKRRDQARTAESWKRGMVVPVAQ